MRNHLTAIPLAAGATSGEDARLPNPASHEEREKEAPS